MTGRGGFKIMLSSAEPLRLNENGCDVKHDEFISPEEGLEVTLQNHFQICTYFSAPTVIIPSSAASEDKVSDPTKHHRINRNSHEPDLANNPI